MKLKKIFYLFRVLFPTWRFFEDMGQVPHLYYRYKKKTQSNYTPWQKAITRPHRHWFHIFINPKGNEFFANYSPLHQLILDIEDWSTHQKINIEETSTYQQLKAIVQYELQSQDPLINAFQFKVEATLPLNSPHLEDQILISKEHIH